MQKEEIVDETIKRKMHCGGNRGCQMIKCNSSLAEGLK